MRSKDILSQKNQQFYQVFPIWNALRSELSWTYYRNFLQVENPHAVNFTS